VSEHPAERFLVVHMDLYRLHDEEDVLQIGWEDYLAQGAVLVVEWPDRAGSLVPADAKRVHFSYGPDGAARTIVLP
jgi:tRNA A37 threonylcarbamoyladenosine biosynthesis protein TsaE